MKLIIDTNILISALLKISTDIKGGEPIPLLDKGLGVVKSINSPRLEINSQIYTVRI